MTEGDRERLKLTANFLNILAAGTVITGGVAPLVAAIFQTSVVSLAGGSLGSLICLAVGYLLHSAGRSLLRRLDR